MRHNPIVNAILFVAAAMGLLAVTGPVVGMLGAMLGTSKVPIWLYASVFSLLMLAATWLALRRDGGLARAGLTLTRHRGREFAIGFAAGAALFSMMALWRGAMVGATWNFAGVDALPAALTGLFVALVFLLPEELLFRGYAFRRLIDAAGIWPAILISAVLFGFYHLVGRPMWGMGAFFTVAMPALGGIVFGWAAVRTRGLALPIGLHLGGNWVQASVLSFQPGADAVPAALWTSQISDVQQRLLFAPDLAPHTPFLAAMLLAALSVRMLTKRAPDAA